MSDDPKLKDLRTEIMPASWLDLKPHHERNSVFLVDTELDLATVALSIVEDRVSEISALIQGAKVLRPTAAQLATWESTEGARTFNFIIVQPYVLIQTMGH